MFFLNTAGHATPPYSGERFSPYKYRPYLYFFWGGGGRGGERGFESKSQLSQPTKRSIYEDKKARDPSDRELGYHLLIFLKCLKSH
jgi:hypothetical protein